MTNVDKIKTLGEQVLHINRVLGIDQRLYPKEECIEVAVEFLNVAKQINKSCRGCIDTTSLVEELIDVIASSYLALKHLNVDDEEIINGIIFKMDRAISQYYEKYS